MLDSKLHQLDTKKLTIFNEKFWEPKYSHQIIFLHKCQIFQLVIYLVHFWSNPGTLDKLQCPVGVSVVS